MSKKLLFCSLFILFSSFCVDIRLMTFNIRRDGKEKQAERHWRFRKYYVVPFIKKNKIDVFGLQEATKNQIQDIAKELPEYQWVGKGRGAGWMGFSLNEHNPIFFNNNKFILLDHGTFNINKKGWISDVIRFRKPKQTGWLRRICTWALLQEKQTGRKILFYNTHLDHQFEQARINGLQTIVERMHKQEKKYPATLTLLMGDFNTNIAGDFEKMMKNFDNTLCNTHSLAAKTTGSAYTFNGWGQEPQRIIDHILIKNNNDIFVKSHHVCDMASGKYLSDHWPVIVNMHI